jgi:outer membrane protein insertion porin family
MMFRHCALIALSLAVACYGDTIRSVRVEGTARVLHLATRAGQPLEQSVLSKDIHQIYNTGAFSDVKVEAAETEGGAEVVFRVVEKPRVFLNRVRVEPHKGPQPPPPAPGSSVDPIEAQQAAVSVRDQLVQEGYRDAKVEPELVPAGARKMDLKLHEDPGIRYTIDRVQFSGQLGLEARDLSGMLRATRSKRVLPLVWTRHAPFSNAALESDLERLRSLYISRGYLDPVLRVGDIAYNGSKATVTYQVRAGERYGIRDFSLAANGQNLRFTPGENGALPSGFCSCLFQRRHEAERAGKMDFAPTIQYRDIPGGGPGAENRVSAEANLVTGQPYTVGRIDIAGNKKYRDSTIRRALVLNEGDPFDWSRLRRSIARVNQMDLFEPAGEDTVKVRRDDAARTADLTITVKEKARGRWYLSGPVGPASVAGPLQAVIQSRLPAWGRGVFETSTYFLTFSYVAFAPPLTRFIPGVAAKTFFPLLGLERRYMPGQWWTSGFILSPQLHWQGSLFSYGASHGYALARKALGGETGAEPPIMIPVERIAVDGASRQAGYLLCEKQRSRWAPLGTGARLALDFWFGTTRPF